MPRVHVVANKVQSGDDADAIRAFCDRHGLHLLVSVPYDEVFMAADREGKAPFDLAPHARGVEEIVRLAGLLEGAPGGKSE